MVSVLFIQMPDHRYVRRFLTNSDNIDETIAVSCGYQTTHIIPFAGDTSLLNISSACRRVGVGGAHISWGMQQLLSLKYPCHVEKFTMPAIDVNSCTCIYRFIVLVFGSTVW